jgi:hypothetical protein
MIMPIVCENSKRLTAIAIDAIVVSDEKLLRNKLKEIAINSSEHIHCYWQQASPGGLKAYFYINDRIECRTFSGREITELIFNSSLIYHFTVREILTSFEMAEIAQAA